MSFSYVYIANKCTAHGRHAFKYDCLVRIMSFSLPSYFCRMQEDIQENVLSVFQDACLLFMRHGGQISTVTSNQELLATVVSVDV